MLDDTFYKKLVKKMPHDLEEITRTLNFELLKNIEKFIDKEKIISEIEFLK